MQSLPQISFLDGVDQEDNPLHSGLESPCDIPGLEEFVDLLTSSDASRNEAVIVVFTQPELI